MNVPGLGCHLCWSLPAFRGVVYLLALGVVTMETWRELILPFTVGALVGFGLAFVLFASRIRFYKQFIERRLAPVNPLRFPVSEGQESPKSSFQ